eukprot:CAMPEP_0114247276 /NCGR_PEP_ID=MMETSP0058-20121206/12935_1 /TAXON_ID=36894 /ORGANISM="Pyramimonas parkeae, CCMP726" /LENGTH=608 /DNA_ID=CAMNT_0001360569 /DNA_START=1679 /DNA_END=3505 /DNA_ORIENTATION=+
MVVGSVQAIRLDPVVEFVRIGCNQQRVDSLVSLRAADDEVLAGSERAEVLLSAVADRSGSMVTSQKLELVKDAISFLVRQLQSRDSFGLVQYADAVQEVIPLLPVLDGRQRAKIEREVASLTPSGCTNISGGLLKGISQHQRKQLTNKAPLTAAQVRAVFLFTDGLANEGVCGTPELVRAMNGALEGVGVANLNVFTFGFGTDHDETMLSELAKSSGGSYYYIESPEKIPAAFADALGGLLSVVGQNIRLVIHPSPGISIKVRTSYPSAACGDDGGVEVNMGDIYSGEARDVVVEADVPAGQEDVVLWTVELQYFDLISNKFQEQSRCAPVMARGSSGGEDAVVPAPDGAFERVAQHKKRIDAIVAMEEGMRLADLGQMRQASDHLKKMLLVIPADAEHDPVSVSINRDLRQMMDSLSTPAGYSSGGRKRMMHKRMEHASQRAAAMGLDHDDKDGEALFSKNPPPSPRPSPMFPPLSMSATRMNKRLALQGSATSGTDFEMREAPELCAEETNLQKLFRRAHMGLAACARRLRLCSTERTAGQYVLWDSPMDQTRTRAVETNMTATGLAPLHETGDGYEEGTLKMRFPDSPYQTKTKADMVSKAARML